ncbi:hypothetical protein [Actinoplanes xinjiangensis]
MPSLRMAQVASPPPVDTDDHVIAGAARAGMASTVSRHSTTVRT